MELLSRARSRCRSLAVCLVLFALLSVSLLAAPVRADADYTRTSTEACDELVRWEDDDEEFRRCLSATGVVQDETDDDGEETHLEYDANGVLRVRVVEEEDGDEVREEYDENGVLRFRETVDDDGDESEKVYDENGVLRLSRSEDDDGDEVVRVYDETGALVDVQRDDDDDDIFDD